MEEDTEKNEGEKRRKILEFKGTEEKGKGLFRQNQISEEPMKALQLDVRTTAPLARVLHCRVAPDPH